MANTRLSAATYVERGYGQVEPNHLSAQRTGQIYAQLPAAKTVNILENGQFAKYNYADGVVDFTGEGEWMLVFNEVKVYYDYQTDNDFAMKKENYVARIYAAGAPATDKENARDYSDFAQAGIAFDGTTNPFVVDQYYDQATMPEGTTMVPRLFKTNVGDIFTTNTVKATELALGDVLAPGADGYLAEAGEDATMKWQVVKVYTMPDGQKGVKIMRIA